MRSKQRLRLQLLACIEMSKHTQTRAILWNLQGATDPVQGQKVGLLKIN
jgi:hypothetical protein